MPADRDYLDDALRPHLDTYGWAIYSMDLRGAALDGADPACLDSTWTATAGLTAQGGCDLVVGGELDEESRRLLIGVVARHLGEHGFPGPAESLRPVDGVEVKVMPLPTSDPLVAVLSAPARIVAGDARLAQVVWLDDDDRWPWDEPGAGHQPLLAPVDTTVLMADDDGYEIVSVRSAALGALNLLATRGVAERRGAELVMFADPSPDMVAVVADAVSRWDRLPDGAEFRCGDRLFYLAAVDAERSPFGETPTIQMVAADGSDLYPWQDGCDWWTVFTQPVLYPQA